MEWLEVNRPVDLLSYYEQNDGGATLSLSVDHQRAAVLLSVLMSHGDSKEEFTNTVTTPNHELTVRAAVLLTLMCPLVVGQRSQTAIMIIYNSV